MKKVFVYILIFLLIFGLNFFIMLWGMSNINSMIAISCIVNFIIFKYMSRVFELNKFLLPIIITIFSYFALGIWYFLTHRCTNCLDVFFIKLLLPVPVITCLLSLLYNTVGKCFYADKNKR